jgi:hypothetical protein
MGKEPLAGLLKGTVEADETYVGGKLRKPAGPSRGVGEPKAIRRGGGRSTRHRTPVVALVEREGGRSVARPTIDATAESLSSIVRANIDLSATLMTDSWRGYIMVGREFAGGHELVDHGAGEYVRAVPPMSTPPSPSSHCLNAGSSAYFITYRQNTYIGIAMNSRSIGIIARSMIRIGQRSQSGKRKVAACHTDGLIKPE